MEKVRVQRITVDGLDSTRALFGMAKGLRFDLIMLSGISFAGFNLVDARSVIRRFRRPVIIVTETRPRNRLVARALKLHFRDWAKRLSYVRCLGRIYCVKTVYNGGIYFEVLGLNYKKAKRIIRQLTFIGKYPEPIRVARLLAQDLS